VARLKYNISARGLGKCVPFPATNACPNPVLTFQDMPVRTTDDNNYVLYPIFNTNFTVLACQTLTLTGTQSLTIPPDVEMINNGVINVLDDAVINVYGTFTNNNVLNV
jgi:hypothetical protein